MAFLIAPTHQLFSHSSHLDRGIRSPQDASLRTTTGDVSPDSNSEFGAGAFLDFSEQRRKDCPGDDLSQLNADAHYLNIAEGSLEELGAILSRMGELATHMGGDHLPPPSRHYYRDELLMLGSEFNSGLNSCLFEGCPVFTSPVSTAHGEYSDTEFPSRRSRPALQSLDLASIGDVNLTPTALRLIESATERVHVLHSRLQRALKTLHGELRKVSEMKQLGRSVELNGNVPDAQWNSAASRALIEAVVSNGAAAMYAQAGIQPEAVAVLLSAR